MKGATGRSIIAIAGIALAAASAHADENADLNSIPGAVQEAPAAPSSTAPAGTQASGAMGDVGAVSGKLYLEDAFTAIGRNESLAVPLPPSSTKQEDWQNRSSVDATGKWRLADGLDATLSDRMNTIEQNNYTFPTSQNLRNDFREGYLTWEAQPQTYLEAGRINVRHGPALGFNPTDFFKTRTQVDLASEDPSVIRNDRLGVAMAQAQTIFDGGSLSLVAAPKIASPSAIDFGPQPSFDPGFERTNATNRFLLSGSYEVADGLSPELLAYHEDGRTRFGANVSRTIGQSIVAYAEWAGGREAGLTSRAITFGQETGTLPPQVVDPDPGEHFTNDVAVGASWTSGIDKLTLNLEYHYHQSGFSGTDWRHWFANAKSGIPGIDGVLWYVRSYAQDQQEPTTAQEVFLRADWSDAFVTDLELSAVAFVDAYDGSTNAQVAATYYISDRFTVAALVGGSIGSTRTEWGSIAQQSSAILQMTRYF